MATRAAGSDQAQGAGPRAAAPLGVDDPARALLPWLAEPLRLALSMPSAHAILAHGPPGVGHLEFVFRLAQALLCEADAGARPCGACTPCRLMRQRSHADLAVLVPDALRVSLGWADDDSPDRPDTKPSKEIRIAQVRQAIAWSQQTSARGGAKVLLIHPADALNLQAANALLKTLEEPPGGLRLVLTSADPERLLPTVRSRCQLLRLALPSAAQARDWLVTQGLARPDELLRLAGGSPLEALAWAEEGVTPEWVAELPRRIVAGDSAPLAGRPIPRVLDLLLKLAHDLMVLGVGGAPRFYAAAELPAGSDLSALSAWQRELLRVARHDDHPWQAPLLVESLVAQVRGIWPRPARGRGASRGVASLHSAP